jgi:hypothetical protein
MDNRDLRSWAQEIVTAFDRQTDHDLPGVLASQGLKLNEIYQKQMAELNAEERQKLLELFKQVAAEEQPDERRKLYAKMARFYEQFFGWEGTQEPGLRSWFII